MSRFGTSTVFPPLFQNATLRPLLAALLALSFTFPARAGNDANGDDPQLEAPIQQGIALRKAGNDEAALALFIDLEHTNPDSVRVLLHVTAAAQATGRWMMAYTYLQKAFAHKNEPYFIRYRAAIKSIDDATAQHVGQFRALGDPIGAEVRLNGELVGTLPMAEAKPVEVGQYVLEVSKGGFYPLRRTVSVGPGSALTQESVALRAGTSAPDSLGAGSAHGGSSTGSGQHAPEHRPWWHARWLTWTLAGATVATATTATVALVVRNNRADDWNSTSCLSGTQTREQVCGDVRGQITTAENVAIGTGIAALVFGGATVTQAILSTERPAAASASVKGPGLRCSPGLASIACFGSF
jgi:hypothetical protein